MINYKFSGVSRCFLYKKRLSIILKLKLAGRMWPASRTLPRPGLYPWYTLYSASFTEDILYFFAIPILCSLKAKSKSKKNCITTFFWRCILNEMMLLLLLLLLLLFFHSSSLLNIWKDKNWSDFFLSNHKLQMDSI